MLDIVNGSIKIAVNGLTATILNGTDQTVNGLKVMNNGYENITASMKINCDKCIAGDNYCPPTCNYASDKDCEKTYEDCENNYDCLIDYSDECVPSFAKRSISTENSEFKVTISYEDRLIENPSGCVLEQTTLDVIAEPTEYYIQTLQNQGISDEDIDYYVKFSQEMSKSMIGEIVNCSFTSASTLTDTLTKFKNDSLMLYWDCSNYQLNGECIKPQFFTPASCLTIFPECQLHVIKVDDSGSINSQTYERFVLLNITSDDTVTLNFTSANSWMVYDISRGSTRTVEDMLVSNEKTVWHASEPDMFAKIQVCPK